MVVLHALSAVNRASPVRSAVTRLLREVHVTLNALLSPNKIIAEVHEMRALQLEADRIEASYPDRAVVLRRRAASIGLH